MARVTPDVLRAPVGLCCAAMGFFCFLPYPAIAVGNASALQIGNVLVLFLSVPALFVSWKRRPFWVFPLLMAPLCISVLKAAVVGDSGLDICLKALATWGISCMAVLATQLCAPRYGLQILTGVAFATLLHAAVGLWQLHGFSQGELPLVDLYVNPSFLSVRDNASTIARYIRRPFGLFPEPSAMSASLAPWVLILFALSCGLVRLWTPTTTGHRLLFGAAALGGLGLIIVSRSGHAAVASLAVVGLVVVWFCRARATPRTFVAVATVFGLFLPVVLYLAAVSVGDRLGGKTAFGNSSWGERADSLRMGFEHVAASDVATNVFGTGVGLMSPALQASAGLDAVFSVLLTYVFETGVVGAITLVWVGHALLRGWASTRYDLTFTLVALVWLVGITLITSYEQLLPLWMTLGWLTVWPQVFKVGGGAVREPATSHAGGHARPHWRPVEVEGGPA
jgi:hypothetical protein